ncbi:MAG: 5-bromo-4-chloroindolyl phosphate hydrolysis family protein [Clostridiaceae bacterium]|nr:5-bromo-4-chloroindolyl phosphate hydrolysis family protein [Clostridiaceae bacterium]
MSRKPDGNKTKALSSPYCFYVAGAAFILYSLIFPMYKITHYLLAALIGATAYFVSSKLLPKQVVKVAEAPVSTGDSLADAAVKEGRENLKALAAIREMITSQNVKDSLSSIESTVSKIMDAIQNDPKKAPRVRRLMSYYLPTLIKLADYYEKLEEQGESGENITGSMARIAQNLLTLDSALKKQLDLLYESDAVDISTDITVMENMLAQEGLSGGMNDKLKQMGGNQ